MNNKTWVCIFTLMLSGNAMAEVYSLPQVLQHIVDKSPALKSAAMRSEKAALDSTRVRSQLGWLIGGQTGYKHDVNFVGAPADTISVGANASRRLESGDQVSMNGTYVYDDSSLTVSPYLPNPSHRTQLDLSYRKPLWLGAGNPQFTEGLAKAESGARITELSQQSLRDQLAQQAIELYFSLLATNARHDSVADGIERAQRLREYIARNKKLGLAEEKDLLQVDAQITALQADRASLETSQGQLRISLSQLMRLDSDASPSVREMVPNSAEFAARGTLYQRAEDTSATLAMNEQQIAIAEATLREARQSKQDQLDAVFSVGTRTANGDSANGTVSEQDYAGSVTLEFRKQADKSGLEAVLSQAMLDRSIALQEKQLLQQDLHYQVDTLVSQIQLGTQALSQAEKRRVSEQAKYNEAKQRYQTARADTFQLIQFENELAQSELIVATQKIELAKKQSQLELMTGVLWQAVVLPNEIRVQKP